MILRKTLTSKTLTRDILKITVMKRVTNHPEKVTITMLLVKKVK